MSRGIKLTLLGLATLALLLIVTLFVLVSFVDPNTYKPQISQYVKHYTGRTLTIKGNLDWRFLPWLGLEMHDVRLGNAPNFGSKPFATTKLADVSVRLFPLLKGDIVIGKVTFQSLHLNLMTNEQGQTNWKNLTARTQQKIKGPAPVAKASSTSDEMFNLLNVNISNIDISDSSIHWEDQKAKQDINLSKLHFSSHGIAPHKAFPIEIGFDIKSKEPEFNGSLNLSMTANLQPSEQNITLHEILLETEIKNKSIPTGKINLHLQGNLGVDVKGQHLHANIALLRIDNVKAAGELDGKNIFEKPKYKGKINISSFNLRELLTKFGKQLPATQDPKTFTILAVATEYDGSANDFSLSNMRIKLDNTSISGEATIKNLATPFAKRSATFNLAVDQFNLDKYTLAAPKEKPSTASAQAHTPLFPIKELRQLNVNGQLDMKQLTVSNLNLTNLKTTLVAKDGMIKIAPTSAKLYEGTYSGAITLDVSKDTPQLSLLESLQDVQLEPFLTDLNNVSDLSGTAGLNAKLTTHGNTLAQLRQTLDGTASITLKNGVYKGVDMDYEINRALASFEKKPAPKPKEDHQTKFNNLNATFHITKGVAHNNDLILTSQSMQITGKGTVNLANERLNYRLLASLLTVKPDSRIYQLQSLLGGGIPINVSGTFSKPKIEPDFHAIGQATAKALIKHQAEKAIKKHAGEEAGKILKEIFQIEE